MADPFRLGAVSESVQLGEAEKIVELTRRYPSVGNHVLFALYKNDGGVVTWKAFRQAVALVRGTETIEDVNRRLADATRVPKRKVRKADGPKRGANGGGMAMKREDLRRGQVVFVRVRYGDGLTKLREAKVLDVMRAAVVVKVDGETDARTVRFNEIELVNSDKPLTAVPQAFAALDPETPKAPKERKKFEPKVSPPVAEKQPAAAPLPDLGEVTKWLAAGASMRDTLAAQSQVLQSEMDSLAAEALRVEEALQSKRADKARVDALIAVLDQMRTAAA
jgi:hypothetical protein